MPRRGIDLTEDQWRIVKSHAASRGQSISQFFADVLGELGMDGHIRPATTIATRSLPVEPILGHVFGESRPAPKPVARKK